jgi:hypothetical protein
MSDCPHDFTERETAVIADGYCPLCMAAELEQLRAERDKLLAALQRIAYEAVDADLKGRVDILSGIAWAAITKTEGRKP